DYPLLFDDSGWKNYFVTIEVNQLIPDEEKITLEILSKSEVKSSTSVYVINREVLVPNHSFEYRLVLNAETENLVQQIEKIRLLHSCNRIQQYFQSFS
ncbi:MAG: hypothetical protein ACI86H_002021, partial [bacterium]